MRDLKLPDMTFLDLAGTIFMVFDLEGRVVFVNEKFCKLMGYGKGDIDAKPPMESFLPKERHARARELFSKLLSGEIDSVSDYEGRLIAKDGGYRDVVWNAGVVKDERGRVTAVLASAVDITDMKRSRDALIESEERFRVASELTSDIIYEWDKTQDRLELYGDVEAKLGMRPSDMPRNFGAWSAIIHPDDRERVLAASERNLTIGEPFYEEYRIKKGDGSYMLVSDKGVVFWDGDKRPYKMIGTITDITERKKAHDEISGWKQRYDIIVAASGQVIYDYDVKTGEIIWGGGTKEVLGFGGNEMRFGIDQWAETIHPDDRPRALKLLDIAQQTFVPYDVEYRYRHKHGHYIWIHDRGFFVPDFKGKAIRMLGVMQDVTLRRSSEDELKRTTAELQEWSVNLERKVEERTAEIKKYQERLVQQEKLAVLGQVSASISHELRTPLTGIKNSVYFMQTICQKNGDKKMGEHLSLINLEVDACVRVLNNMLDFVRPKEPIRKLSRLDLVATESVKSALVPSNIRVSTKIDKDLPSMMIDFFQIRQVFDNIIRNAFDAMASGGDLVISVSAEGDEAVVKFKDTGVGISREHLPKIFDPLFSTTPTGVGLGLTIARQFIEAHGGTIEVESEPDKGTTVKVRLPVAAA